MTNPVLETKLPQAGSLADHPSRIDQAWSGSAPVPLTPSASPYVVQNVLGMHMDVFVSGGTVTTIEFSRDGTTWFLVGLLAGQFHLSPLDKLRITYVIVPTVTAVIF